MDLLTEMRIPTRAAPRPPSQPVGNPPVQRNSSNVWGDSNDPFGSPLHVPQKKKPPPRPPPPKFPPNYRSQSQDKPKKPARPTELLSNLFGRTKSKLQQNQQQQSNYGSYSNRTTTTSLLSTNFLSSSNSSSTNLAFPSSQKPSSSNDAANTSFSLIDLSPPGSPTFTTRSSSDAVSVDSFGSDGNSNPSAFASSSSGSASQTESAFEDDFDFFGNLGAANALGKKQQPDPWRVSCTQDPFGSLETSSVNKPVATTSTTNAVQQQQQQWPSAGCQPQIYIKEIGESNFFAFNEATTSSTTTSSSSSASASASPFDSPSRQFNMPTIIWPKKMKSKDSSSSSNSSSGLIKTSVYQSSASSKNYGSAPKFAPAASLVEEKSPWGDENDEEDVTPASSSPPMPKQPPPPPPPEYIAGLEDGLMDKTERPYGIALYDFPAAQPGDLELKEGDVVHLTKLINENWMEGRVGSRQGMFPVNFLDVKVPLPGLDTNVVNALYSFKAETSDDLSFEEGARIKVLSRISDDWLYGEYQGKKGQFPANFVDKVPNDLPNHL